jgi:hypothetical protein
MLSDPTVLILMYFVLPLWLVAGFADWLCHRASHIEHACDDQGVTIEEHGRQQRNADLGEHQEMDERFLGASRRLSSLRLSSTRPPPCGT